MQPDFSTFDRQPAFAGQFYPEGSKELRDELMGYFSGCRPALKTGVCPMAIISPHAGYLFSGKVAASAFNQIPEGAVFKRIFLIGSSHRYSFNGAAVYYRGDFLTPLGRIKVDQELGRELAANYPVFLTHDKAHLAEHSLEVQLPFIRFRFHSDFMLIPVLMGTHHPGDCEAAAAVLEKWFTPENLFIVSTDFSHYPDYDSAVDVDRKTASAIQSNNPGELLRILEENKKQQVTGLATSLCGWTSVLALLNITKNKSVEYQPVEYLNSGDNVYYGDKHRVVGYQAMAVYHCEDGLQLSSEERSTLIRIARESVKNEIFQTHDVVEPINVEGHLSMKMGAFVSIYCGVELKGCIGSFRNDTPLSELVRKMAASATHDSRFKPMAAGDLHDFQVEISVLSPLRKISNPEEIVMGKHGIYIKKGFYSGTFLPQVAASWNWSREEFLGRCSRDKAGLGWNGWKNAELFVYEAEIIREKPDSGELNAE